MGGLSGDAIAMRNGRTGYLNGQFVPEADLRVLIFDSALVSGDMVFETKRSSVRLIRSAPTMLLAAWRVTFGVERSR